MARTKLKQRGSTLLESLLALVCFLMILQAGLEFFGMARAAFYKLEDSLSARESAQAALERIRVDVLLAGLGLAGPIALGLVSGIDSAEGGMAILSLEKSAVLAADARAGDASLTLADASDFGPGRIVLLMEKGDGEVLTAASVAGNSLRLDSPIARGHAAADSEILLLRKVAFAFDSETSVLKRKVNASSAQPLLEGVASFSMSGAPSGGLVTSSLALQEKPGRTYTISIFPRNLALARSG
jgi:type II secretory pathway pseudopilin PulG